MGMKEWVLPPLDKDAAAELAEQCNIHPFLAVLLLTRGITDPETVEDFLYNRELRDDPFAFADMDLAVERIQRAMDNGEKILVFGDYDADGITSTLLLYLYLKQQNAQVSYYIPTREEGYGLSKTVIEAQAALGITLIVTVDNGIAAMEEVDYATSLGVDVVITDHHQPQDILPNAVAVVDPHRPDCGSVCKDYAGVGVAFKLVSALHGDDQPLLESFADLVALGTIADVMPLRGENRVLVQHGLKQLNRNARPGLKALLEIAGVSEREQTASSLVFTISPRINAAGRMGHPEKAALLLLAENESEALALAKEIHELNSQRQAVESDILKEALEQIRLHPEWLHDRVLVLNGNNWYHGVIGIIAARILERYGKPCLIVSLDGETARGSGRSIAGFSLFDAVAACEDTLTSFGGHELAVGINLMADKVENFRRAINAYAARCFPRMPVPQLRLDCKLRPNQIDLEKLTLLSMLEPFGAGNAAPLFGLFHMTLDSVTAVGNGRHLRLSLSRDGARISAMRFHCTQEAFSIPCGSAVNLVVSLDRNEFRGVVSPSLIVKDIRYADTDQEAWINAFQTVEGVLREDLKQGNKPLPPEREQLGTLYRFLRQRGTFEGSPEQLLPLVKQSALNEEGLLLGVRLLEQAGLITLEDNGATLRITLIPTDDKTDLTAVPMMQYLTHGE